MDLLDDSAAAITAVRSCTDLSAATRYLCIVNAAADAP
jgi:hypothetical protein